VLQGCSGSPWTFSSSSGGSGGTCDGGAGSAIKPPGHAAVTPAAAGTVTGVARLVPPVTDADGYRAPWLETLGFIVVVYGTGTLLYFLLTTVF